MPDNAFRQASIMTSPVGPSVTLPPASAALLTARKSQFRFARHYPWEGPLQLLHIIYHLFVLYIEGLHYVGYIHKLNTNSTGL